MKLDVYFDLGNVAGFLALPGLHKLVAETGIEVNCLPIQGIVPRPLSPEPTKKADDPLADYKQLRWQAKHDFEVAELDRDCERFGLKTQKATRVFDATLTHLALLYLRDHPVFGPLQFIEQIYAARFRNGMALETADQVGDLLAKLNLDPLPLLSQLDEWTSSWESHKAAYLELGIHDSPAFLLDEETFQGRQHFPLLKWQILKAKGVLDPSNLGTPPV